MIRYIIAQAPWEKAKAPWEKEEENCGGHYVNYSSTQTQRVERERGGGGGLTFGGVQNPLSSFRSPPGDRAADIT